jgi:hypothetical protein
MQELIAGIPREQKDDTVSRIYGQHGFARWFERHFYDWFHDPDDNYVAISENPSLATAVAERPAESMGETTAIEDAGGVGTTSAAEQPAYLRPKEPSSAIAAASTGVPIQESDASVKHSKLLSRLLSSPEVVSPASDATG